MYYDLDAVEELALELGFGCIRVDRDSLRVTILDGAVLEFLNVQDEEDTLLGFRGFPWHMHGKVILGTGDMGYCELDELDVLLGLREGRLLLVEEYKGGKLVDRFLVHKDERVDLQYIEPGEELRYRRLA